MRLGRGVEVAWHSMSGDGTEAQLPAPRSGQKRQISMHQISLMGEPTAKIIFFFWCY
jgi:hypothetical protein